MSEIVQHTPQEFWRPPSPARMGEAAAREALPTMAEACPRCGTEFLLGSRFCHSCGGRRPEALSPAARADAAEVAGLWERAVARVHSLLTGIPWRRVKLPNWLPYFHIQQVRRWIGLSTASLIAFIIGAACIAGALLVGLLTAKTLVDWQAIQFYRVEWLLAATALFAAGILLKRPPGN